MESKPLYTIGNLFTGYPWGVEAIQHFDSVDVYGPFSTENAANTFMHQIAQSGKGLDYKALKVINIETPQAGSSIVKKEGRWEYDS